MYGNGMQETHSYTTAGLLAWKNFLPAANLAIGLKTEYSWDNEGRMTQMKYPMTGTADGQGGYTEVPGSLLVYSYDSAGRMTGMTRDGNPVVSNATWNAAGQPLSMGTYSFGYNDRGQMTSENGPGGSASYIYSATANDGRVQRRQRSGGISETVDYLYDELGRLVSAATTGPEWGLSWTYDGFGNRLAQNVTKGNGIGPVISVDPATNRISTSGFSYDANGNMTQWPLGGNTITGSYDVENRLVSASGAVYKYNAANQRVVVGEEYADPRYSVYGLNGELLGEYQKCSIGGGSYVPCNRSERVYFAGRYMQKDGNSVAADRLGTVGTAAGYPYGESSDEFATYGKDGGTGLHYAWNRYYSATWGRFATPDPYRASRRAANNPMAPQSWNRYTYVLNDPVNLFDPRGTTAKGPRFVCPDQSPEGTLGLDCELEDEEGDTPGPGGPSPGQDEGGGVSDPPVETGAALDALKKEACWRAMGATRADQARSRLQTANPGYADYGGVKVTELPLEEGLDPATAPRTYTTSWQNGYASGSTISVNRNLFNSADVSKWDIGGANDEPARNNVKVRIW